MGYCSFPNFQSLDNSRQYHFCHTWAKELLVSSCAGEERPFEREPSPEGDSGGAAPNGSDRGVLHGVRFKGRWTVLMSPWTFSPANKGVILSVPVMEQVSLHKFGQFIWCYAIFVLSSPPSSLLVWSVWSCSIKKTVMDGVIFPSMHFTIKISDNWCKRSTHTNGKSQRSTNTCMLLMSQHMMSQSSQRDTEIDDLRAEVNNLQVQKVRTEMQLRFAFLWLLITPPPHHIYVGSISFGPLVQPRGRTGPGIGPWVHF